MRHRPDLQRRPRPRPPYEKELLNLAATFVPTTASAKALMGPDARLSHEIPRIDFNLTAPEGAAGAGISASASTRKPDSSESSIS